METFLIKAAQLIAALALLVIIHEFGHFLWARVFKIRVEKFYIFFNPWLTLAKWKPKNSDTEYGLGWLPLGGYVKIAGMIDESMDTEQMKSEPKPDEFRAKPAWQRLLVMTGGVLNNLILAFVIYVGIAWYWGEKSIPYENYTEGFDFQTEAQALGFRNGDRILLIDGQKIDISDPGALMDMLDGCAVTVLRNGTDTVNIVLPKDAINHLNTEKPLLMPRVPVYVKKVMNGDPAAKAGLKEGDRIIAVGDSLTPSFTELSQALTAYAGKATSVTYLRGNDTIVANTTPTSAGKLGFELESPLNVFKYNVKEYNFFEAIPAGVHNGTQMLVTYVGSLKYIFTKQGAQSIGGFGAIGSLFPPKWNWLSFWEMTAFLSIILAIMNLLPIPALDGGHVMFLLWEVVTRRKPSDKFLERAQIAGMFFLFALLIYANFNDIYRFLIK